MKVVRRFEAHQYRRFCRNAGLCLLLCLHFAVMGALPVAANSESAHVALFVLVDSSGSMKNSDSRNLRWTGTRLLASLLSDGDEIAIFSFNSVVTPFQGSPTQEYGPLIRVGRDVGKEDLLADLSRFAESNQPDGYTDMLAALKTVEPLVLQARESSQPYVVLLTDGRPEVESWQPGPSEKGLTYEEAILQELRKIDVPVYAGGLWPEGACKKPDAKSLSGQQFLQQLVATAPEGWPTCISGAEELPSFFLQTFGRISNRQYQPLEFNGRFEIREDQVGIIRQMTLIYIQEGMDCRETGRSSHCPRIYDPSGQSLTLSALAGRTDIEYWLDDDFIVLSVREPTAGTWLIEGEGGNAYAILETGLRLKVTAAERQAVDQSLSAQVQILLESQEGTLPLPEDYEPVFLTATLALLGASENHVPSLDLDLFFNPTTNVYEARSPAVEESGIYLVSIVADVGGFVVAGQGRVHFQPFPQLTWSQGLANGAVAARFRQAIEIRLEAQLDGRAESIDGLLQELCTVTCNGQSIPIQLESLPGNQVYVLSFMPPQTDQSQCRLQIQGEVRHLGTAYYLLYEQPFSITVEPELSLQVENQDLGEIVPFQELTVTGYATLFSSQPVAISAHSATESPMQVSVSPGTLIPGESTSLLFTLVPQASERLPYGHYEGVIVLEPAQQVFVSGTSELRYTFTLIPPSIKHSVSTKSYLLDRAISAMDDDIAVIDFYLTANLSAPGTLLAKVADEQGNPLPGVIPVLSPTVIPTTGIQEYSIRLQSTGQEDPWPVGWFRSRPVTFSVALSADPDPDTQILPTSTFLVSGTRLSRLASWWLRTATVRLRLVRYGLFGGSALLALWMIMIGGWAIVVNRQHTKVSEPLIPVNLNPDNTLTPCGRSIGLGSYRSLKQRLFGIRLCVGKGEAKTRPAFRLLPPHDFWRWLLSADKADYSDTHSPAAQAEFQLQAERRPGSRPIYMLTNLHQTPLLVRRAQGNRIALNHEATIELKTGDVALTTENQGLHFGARVMETRGGQQPAPTTASRQTPDPPLSAKGGVGPTRRNIGDVSQRMPSGNSRLADPPGAPKRRTNRDGA